MLFSLALNLSTFWKQDKIIIIIIIIIWIFSVAEIKKSLQGPQQSREQTR